MLLLDALYPPSPAQLVADCKALGASGCWVYVWRGDYGCGSWTVAHVEALHAAGLLALGVVVPGDTPPPAAVILSSLGSWGLDRVLAADFESGSEPANAWWQSFEPAAVAAGWLTGRYGTTSELGRYSPGEYDWIASWLRYGNLNPIPSLPAGWHCWQFVDDVRAHSGAEYDVSVVDASWLAQAVPAPVPAPLSLQEGPMRFLTVNIVGQEQQHIFYVDPDGWLRHFFWSPTSNGWQGNPTGANACVPFGALDAVATDTQLHVIAARTDGRVVHSYQDIGSPTWTNEIIAP